mmetsp:Transcript_5206/g.10585  ORF Transcript_5206/g.10585 Transcript_5206/m.10585 type:complete len:124 (-) Transcript_5206:27-398(-)
MRFRDCNIMPNELDASLSGRIGKLLGDAHAWNGDLRTTVKQVEIDITRLAAKRMYGLSHADLALLLMASGMSLCSCARACGSSLWPNGVRDVSPQDRGYDTSHGCGCVPGNFHLFSDLTSTVH